jgi:hypothetical protein
MKIQKYAIVVRKTSIGMNITRHATDLVLTRLLAN